jgi:hypothetical protein
MPALQSHQRGFEHPNIELTAKDCDHGEVHVARAAAIQQAFGPFEHIHAGAGSVCCRQPGPSPTRQKAPTMRRGLRDSV